MKLSGDKFQFLIDYIIRINNGKFLVILYTTPTKIVYRGVFSEEGGHFAGMPMVADGRDVAVKNNENLRRRLKWMVP